MNHACHRIASFLPRAAAVALALAAVPAQAEIKGDAIRIGVLTDMSGAFASADQARHAAEQVRDLSPRELGSARVGLGTTSPFGGQRLYPARLVGLSARTAALGLEMAGRDRS